MMRRSLSSLRILSEHKKTKNEGSHFFTFSNHFKIDFKLFKTPMIIMLSVDGGQHHHDRIIIVVPSLITTCPLTTTAATVQSPRR
jgi:hypothetical protein